MLNEKKKRLKIHIRRSEKLLVLFTLVFLILLSSNKTFVKALEVVIMKAHDKWYSEGEAHFVWTGTDLSLWFCNSKGEKNARPNQGIPKEYNLKELYKNNLLLHLKMSLTQRAMLSVSAGGGGFSYQEVQKAVWSEFTNGSGASLWITKQAEQIGVNINGNISKFSTRLPNEFTIPDKMYPTKEEAAASKSTWVRNESNGEFIIKINLNETQAKVLNEPGVQYILPEVSGLEWRHKIIDNQLVITYYGKTKRDGSGNISPEVTKPLHVEIPLEVLKKYNISGIIDAESYKVYVLHFKDGQDFIRGLAKNIPQHPVTLYVDFYSTPIIVTDSEKVLHDETFNATYNIKLNKYDYETGQPLENSKWQVLEAFNSSQAGIGNGHNGTLSLSMMSPQPPSWKDYHICSQYEYVTGADGNIEHSDLRQYRYKKTYCTGHPEPELSDDEEANENAMAIWKQMVVDCSREASFHSIEPNVAMNAMLADRDATYQNFINLEYQYTVREIAARNGYTLHNHHTDDVKIPVVTLRSSESGVKQKWAGLYEKDIKLDSNSVYSDAPVQSSNNGKEISDDNPDGKSGFLERVKRIGTRLFAPVLTEIKDEITESIDRLRTVELEEYFEDDNEIDAEADEDGSLPEDTISGLQRNKKRFGSATKSNAVKKASPSDAQSMIITYTIHPEAYPDESLTEEVTEPPVILLSDQDSPAFAAGGCSENPDADISNYNDKKSKPKVSVPNPSDTVLMNWKIYDHRTEGEIHFNKRDLDLSDKEGGQYTSYGESNGDGTLEGAVYGLFAKSDIIHPDGKTGAVFKAGELVSVGTTDRNGDGSFMVITEAPGTTVDKDGNIVSPLSSATNLFDMDGYQDDYTEDSEKGRIYSNNVKNNGNAWIGRPLICNENKYEIRELYRSEGYELSVYGKDRTVTNYKSPDVIDPGLSGYARSSRPVYSQQDGGTGALDQSKVMFYVSSKGTTDGYTVSTSEFPQGTTFYAILHERKEVEQTVQGPDKWEEVKDENGNIVYKKHEAGEIKYDKGGNPMLRKHSGEGTSPPDVDGIVEGMNKAESADYIFLDGSGNVMNIPVYGMTAFVKYREAMSYTSSSADIRNQVSAMLDTSKKLGDMDEIKRVAEDILLGKSGGSSTGLGYTKAADDSPWITINLKGTTNAELITSIVDWFVLHPQWNAALIEDVYQGVDGKWKAVLLYDYKILTNGVVSYPQWSYDKLTKTLYYKAEGKVTGKNGASPVNHRIYIPYADGELSGIASSIDPLKFAYFNISQIKKVPDDKVFTLGEDISLSIYKVYRPLYECYTGNEFLLDAAGNKIPQMHLVPTTEIIKVSTDEYQEESVKAVWSKEKKAYTINISEAMIKKYGENLDGTFQVDFTAKAPSQTVTVDGVTMDYGMYLQNHANVSADAKKSPEQLLAEKSTYVQGIQLNNPGQLVPVWSGQTEHTPLLVQERPIRQKVKILKEIQTNPDGTYEHDTYNNKTTGNGKLDTVSALQNFRFKIYLKSNLERLYRDNNGNVIWLDRNGNPLSPVYKDTNGDGRNDTFVWKTYDGSIRDYPEVVRDVKDDGTADGMLEAANVQKIYTRVSHKTQSNTIGDISNNVWDTAITANHILYDYKGKNSNAAQSDRISAVQNPGYTRILETVYSMAEDEAGNQAEVGLYNYKKFFDAVKTANTDKWDSDQSSSKNNYPGQNWSETFYPEYQKDDENTSFKPFRWLWEHTFGTGNDYARYPVSYHGANTENRVNTSDAAHANAESSDAVRQFAIDWYLKDEAAKLMKDKGHQEDQALNGMVDYSDEVYDQALKNAIEKADNYLKPFFAYDLDTIYSIPWDSAKSGGSDHDYTTLGADELYQGAEPYCYGVSVYLPYGTYVIAEQQPGEKELGDFPNKNYETDVPKEITLPMVYKEGGNLSSPVQLNEDYNYDPSDTPEDMILKYKIRFNEEWADNHTDDLRNYVIRAHSYHGDYEVYKYGLDAERLAGTITCPEGAYNYKGFEIIQEGAHPLKDYYNTMKDHESEGGNPGSHYYADDQDYPASDPGAHRYQPDEIEKRYHYASISEHAGIADYVMARDEDGSDNITYRKKVRTMTGIQTAYEGYYAPMLVPWSVTEPGVSDVYAADEFIGYSDKSYRNKFYYSKLRIEKLDSDTGENLLHGGVIFAIYAAERNTEQYGGGEVSFYDKDTIITGSREFLEAMGAYGIQPLARDKTGGVCYGTVPKGTPVCKEEDQIIMTDTDGNKTGEFKVYTTVRDGMMSLEEEDGLMDAEQSVGYFVTPQPLGAGTYVIAEIAPSAGYVRSKPIAVEIYSDAIEYYMDGDVKSKVSAAKYKIKDK